MGAKEILESSIVPKSTRNRSSSLLIQFKHDKNIQCQLKLNMVLVSGDLIQEIV